MAYLLAFAALCAVLVAAASAIPSAGARSAKTIGKTKNTPAPACPTDTPQSPCSVVGRATGFMTVADGKKHPFNVFKDGKIVAWAIDLSKPNKSQRNFFVTLFKNKRYADAPTARIAVLKHAGRKHRKSYKLVRQSPVVQLGGALGQKEVITLDKPLRVRKGQIVALTYPTWASNFASNVKSSDNQWRASRRSDNCAPKKDTNAAKLRFARHSHAQQKVSSTHRYGCLYKGGRLLYWAYYVPDQP
jgi:hypothetical protein